MKDIERLRAVVAAEITRQGNENHAGAPWVSELELDELQIDGCIRIDPIVAAVLKAIEEAA